MAFELSVPPTDKTNDRCYVFLIRVGERSNRLLPRLFPLLLFLSAPIGLVATTLWSTGAGACEFTQSEKACFRVIADRSAYEAGAKVRLAAVVEVQDGWHVNSNLPTFDYLIPTEVQWATPAGWAHSATQYPTGEMQTFAFSGQPISVYDGEFSVITSWTTPAASSGPLDIKAVLRYQACTDDRCLPPIKTEVVVTLSFDGGGELINPSLFDSGARPSLPPPASLWLMIAFALLGGLILNVMPCVLPVLSLKLFSLSKSAGEGRAAVVTGALATTAGILVSFLALAILAIGLRAGGAAVGWGTQFQEPVFVAALAVIVLVFCLNLWGVFEINLPGWLSSLGGTGPVEGLTGHFTTGLFTTLMATPCTAPFLGTAVGFALAQDSAGVLAVFTAIGVGMASPYLVLAMAPGAARVLPRPGQWMVQLKIVLGFLLVAAAVWLLYVLGRQVGAQTTAYIQLSMLGVALFLWAGSQAKTPGFKNIMRLGTVASIVAVLGVANGGRDEMGRQSTTTDGSGLITWRTFDQQEALSLASNGNQVFVDVTAEWCFTCKINKTLVLDSDAVGEAFAEHEVTAMRADWTSPDARIARFLGEFGRSGIPFYVLYRPDGTTHVFSEILSTREVIDALAQSTDDR